MNIVRDKKNLSGRFLWNPTYHLSFVAVLINIPMICCQVAGCSKSFKNLQIIGVASVIIFTDSLLSDKSEK